MKRSFWTTVFVLMTLCGGWAVYTSAQELQELLTPHSEADNIHYQFVDHFFSQNGQRYEIFLRLDRTTGQTWRFHASNPTWTPINEGSEGLPATDGKDNRFELMSHVYVDGNGIPQEMFLRVDVNDGRSWKYHGMASTWEPITVEGMMDAKQVAQDPATTATE